MRLHKVKIHLKTELTYFIPVVLDSSRQICECQPGADAAEPVLHH